MYLFEDFELDPRQFELRREGARVHMERQVFEVLLHLVRHRDRVVAKAELLDAVWGTHFVAEATLASRLREVRRALGDDGRQQRMVSTVHGVGYRFVAPVQEVDGVAASSPASPRSPSSRSLSPASASSASTLSPPTQVPSPGPPTAPVHRRRPQDIRFACSRDGLRIAWATSGAGPVLVKAANWLTHLDYEWESPIWAHWIDALSSRHLLLRYDERGCGLSDWEVEDFSLDAWVEDLELVVDSAGVDRFDLLGLSQGGAVAIAYAVRHPERVRRMVLVGAYSRGRLARAATAEDLEEAAVDLAVAKLAWRRDDSTYRQAFAAQFLPEAPRTRWEAFNTLQRRTTSTGNVVRFLDTFARIDVSAIAPQVRCPTLVLHSRRDERVPEAQARELARLVPDSRLRLLDSGNHILTADEPAWEVLLDEIESFLAVTDE